MEKKTVTVKILGKTREYPMGITYAEIVKEYEGATKYPIVLVMKDGKLRALHKRRIQDGTLEFITTADEIALYNVAGHDKIKKAVIHYAVSSGYYVTVEGDVAITEDFLLKVKEYMLELVEKKIPVMKRSVGTDEAISLFHKHKMYDKENLFRYRRVSRVNIYSIEEFEDYFYGYMAYSTGILKYFDLIKYDEGFVLQLPTKEEPEVVPEFVPRNKVYNVIKKSTDWAEMFGVPTIGYLNDKITDGSMNNIMMVQEALQEKRIGDVAADIASRENVKVVMIAGPSSSGKTSFSHRLSIQLMAQGLKPHPISVDNYCVNREDTPRDADGKLDYEVIEALDVKFFNEQMTDLLAGKEVELPVFDFVSGKRKFNGDYLIIGEFVFVVIEGIHCLIEKMSYSLPDDKKYKIYVSALTPINVDEHNRVSTSDLRLLRRIVRDVRTRGSSAERTIEMWQRVRRGEEKNIFPYQDTADVVFDTAMVYELSVLKTYAEPALFSVPEGTSEYLEAKRLLKCLDYVLGMPKDTIPHNSLVREFVGGSIFPVG